MRLRSKGEKGGAKPAKTAQACPWGGAQRPKAGAGWDLRLLLQGLVEYGSLQVPVSEVGSASHPRVPLLGAWLRDVEHLANLGRCDAPEPERSKERSVRFAC